MEYVLGPSQPFPVVYVIPVCLAAWYSGPAPALILAAAVPLFRLAELAQHPASNVTTLALSTLARGTVVAFAALWFARLADLERALERRVKVLEGLLAICSFCKRIRNERGTWEQLEAFISRSSEAEFSHGLCPACGERHYPGMLDEEVDEPAMQALGER
jgi:hypothetical protein